MTPLSWLLATFTIIGMVTVYRWCFSHLDALRDAGCSRVAARALELRDAGYPVRTRLIKVEKGDGSTARVAEYSMGKVA